MKYFLNNASMLGITELAKRTGASVDELRYLERKGLLNPSRTQLKRRKVRQYQEADIRRVQLIIKYHRQGFTWDVAFQKAMREMENPLLL